MNIFRSKSEKTQFRFIITLYFLLFVIARSASSGDTMLFWRQVSAFVVDQKP